MSKAIYPVFKPLDISFDFGEGMYLYASNGVRYLDFAAGIAVNSLGHCHPKLVAALSEQASKLWHVSNMYQIAGQERLAQRLCAATFAQRVFFTNSGSEAIECAIKTARRYFSSRGQPQRYRVITFNGSFHGRTHAAIAAGGRLEYLAGFGPPLEGFDQVEFGDIAGLRSTIGNTTAAIMLETVLGEGGIQVWPPAELRQIAQLARENDLLLIIDEVQCGVARTGTFMAYEQAGIEPDIVAIAKGIGGGFPMGACLASEAACAGMTTGSHGSTFGGNPLAMAVGNAVLDLVLQDEFLSHVSEVGYYLGERLDTIVKRYECVKGRRGMGLMQGLVFAPQVKVLDIRARMQTEHQVLVAAAARNTLRLLPPLIARREHINEAVDALELLLDSVSENQ